MVGCWTILGNNKSSTPSQSVSA